MATTFSVSSGDYVRPYRNARIQHFPEDASQTFKRGEVLIKGGAGVENRCKVASNDPTSAILGIAAADASGVTNTMIPVWLADNNAEFIARSISTSAVDFTAIGTLCAIEKDATNVIWVIDIADAGNDAVTIVNFLNPTTRIPQLTEGDTSVWVVFKFVPAATVWQGTV